MSKLDCAMLPLKRKKILSLRWELWSSSKK